MKNAIVLVRFNATDSCGNGYFILNNMQTGEKKYIFTHDLLGNLFKMRSCFLQTFKSAFPNKNKVVLTDGAEDEVNFLIRFNKDNY